MAIEEGYLANVFKAPREAGAPGAPAKAQDLSGLVTSADFEKFKTQFLDELKAQLPALQKLERLDKLQAQPAWTCGRSSRASGSRSRAT